MLRKLRPRSAYDVMAAIAFFIAVAGGSAYAAATIGSGNIENNAVLSRHIKDGAVQSADLGANSVGGGKVIDNSLTGNDINESTLAGVVHGRGSLLSNRLVFVPTEHYRVLLTVPGLGELHASCAANGAYVSWKNTTGSNVDVWQQNETNALFYGAIAPKKQINFFGFAGSSSPGASDGGTISLGIGNDPGPRRVATLHAFAYQSADGAPCGFQAQGTLWTSP